MAALDKIFELLDEEPDLAERRTRSSCRECAARSASTDVPSPTGAASDRVALCDVDCTVPPGQTVALVGATGAGKSTFAKLVARFYDPTRPRAHRRPRPARGHRALAAPQLGMVPQEGFLFSGTVRDNIAFGRPDATDEEVAAAARAVGAHEFIERLPEGYDTEVGERGSHLSAGQRQLVAFAARRSPTRGS